jgi:hypothetical protein
MVYKKYIKRNGKVYGPYIYHSKRVDGKVVSEYRGGLKKPKNYINFLLIFISVVLVGFLIFFLVSSEKVITGQATLDLDAEYKPGEILKGKLDLSLKEGEFIPADSKIIIENNGNTQEFNLRDFTSNEIEQGDYYVEGKNIQGEGEGYGFQGASKEYPEIYFELNVYTEENTGSSGGGGTEEPVEETPEEPVVEEEPVEEEVVEEEVVEEEPVEEEVVEEEIVEEEPVEETPAEIVEEEIVEEEPVEETPEEPTETAPVTGNFVAKITGAFLGLTPTGQVSLELEKGVEGKVKFGEEFIYELSSGESAELKPLSVRTSSGQELDDSEIKVQIQDNKVIVTTNYDEKEKGYGEEFLGDELTKVSVNLEDLNLNVEEGDLNIKFIYEEKEILSLSSSLSEGGVTVEETPEEPVEEPETNETEETNETVDLNETEVNESVDLNGTEINKTISITSVEPLSIQEKALLLGYFGDSPIEVVKSEMFKDRIIVGYKLGGYEIEFSYDSSISPELLEKVMENDRIIWLRDLSKSLSPGSESSRQELDLGNSTDNLTLKNI